MSELSDSSVALDRQMSPYAESLLAHAGWVRQLARTLVVDPNLADDLVQETWVKALQRPPRGVGNVRAWLATVLRNLVRQNHRADVRRQHHERRQRHGVYGGGGALHEPGHEPATSDLVEQVATEKQIVEAVLALDEPYRTAVLMRYYEDLPPRKIAARLKLPVSTVHTHITRGIEKLRLRLDREYGERRTWMLALLPSIPPASSVGSLLGAAVMNSKLQIALAGVAALVLGTAVAWPILSGPDERSGAEDVQMRLAGDVRQGEGTEPDSKLNQSRRVLDPSVGSGAKKPEPTNAAPLTIRGRLVDATATPLAGLGVGFRVGRSMKRTTGGPRSAMPTPPAPPAPLVRSVENGRFVIEVPAEKGEGRLQIHARGWRTVLAPVVHRDGPRNSLVVAAPAIDLAGRVVDETGSPVTEARMKITVPEGFRARFTEVHDSAIETFQWHRSGADGSFEIPEACFIEQATLVVSKPGFGELKVPLPRQSNRAMVIRFARLAAHDENTISGQVLDQQGRIVEGAWVTLGLSSVKSDAQGSFTLKVPKKGPTKTLLAVKKGLRPGRMTRPEGEAGWPAQVVLRLGGAPLSIVGRVVDAGGQGVGDARVWVYDGEFCGRIDRTPTTVQGLVTGAPTRSELMRLVREEGKNPREVMRTTPTAMWPFTRTRADGTFTIGGLDNRRYILRAMIDETLLMAEVAATPGQGAAATIQFPRESYYPRLSGRVVSMKGRAIANAEIYTMCDPARVRIGDGATTQHQTAQRRRTDKNGRFVFERVPRNLVYLRVDHKDIVAMEYGRRNEGGLAALVGGDPSQVLIRVQTRVHVKVVLQDPTRADGFEVLDARNRSLPINQYQGDGRRTSRRQSLHDGKSVVVAVPETAARIVLYKGNAKVDEWGINLVVGTVNEIRR